MKLVDLMEKFLGDAGAYTSLIGITDIIEIIIIAIIVYFVMKWLKNTRAWQLFKGLFVIAVFLLISYILQFNTILWLARNLFSFLAIAMIVVLQPELRHALEELGKRNFISKDLFFDTSRAAEDMQISEKSIGEIARGCSEMSKVKTGALIVIERNESLRNYERTGIDVDGIVTSQLLINIFEKNTPLHDGAVIVRGNRVVSATCYLPLSDNLALSKDLGTRHRAAVGISEETDSVTIIVSEETGAMSIAFEGRIMRELTADDLKQKLTDILIEGKAEKSGRVAKILKGRGKKKDEK